MEISIEEYYTEDGRRTCRLTNHKICKMLLAAKNGLAFQCQLFPNKWLESYDDYYLKPSADCLKRSSKEQEG
jgi:hypothetical protein